jgi:hypothetical protein
MPLNAIICLRPIQTMLVIGPSIALATISTLSLQLAFTWSSLDLNLVASWILLELLLEVQGPKDRNADFKNR